jgi:UDP-N-acetylmuramyl pentapeptide phosphotransferase/UDP-N-acetylglucosamine-1-phosphate transferase
MRSRPFWLSTTYMIVVVFTWPILAFVALGIADALFDIRQRYRRSKPPPLPAA